MSQTLARGLDILLALGDGPQTISDVAAHLEVHHSTALRLLHTLEAARFVIRANGRYQLGPRVAWLGQLALEQVDLRAVARPFIESLGREIGETVHLAMLVDTDVIYIDKFESSHPVRMYSQVGKSAPLHCTGVAKAIAYANDDLRRVLRELPQPYTRYTERTRVTFAELERDFAEAAERGFVLDDREHEESIHCIAAPVRSGNGFVTRAISVTVPVHRCSPRQLLSYAEPLKRAADGVSAALGHFG